MAAHRRGTMSNSSGAVGRHQRDRRASGAGRRTARRGGDAHGARDRRGAARRGGVGVVVDGGPDGGDGRRPGDRPRLRRLVHGRVGDDDGGDDAAVARAGGSRLCGVGPTRAQPGAPVRRRLSARLECRGHRRLRPVRAWQEPARRLAGLAQRRPLACGGRSGPRRALPADAAQARVPLAVPQPAAILDSRWQNTRRGRAR